MSDEKDYVPLAIVPKNKLVYDVHATPKGLDIATFTKLFEQHNIVFWDSSTGGTKPKLFGVDGEAPLLIVDTEGKELDLEFYSKEFKDKEFWEKELHRCHNSPIYFYSNYGTTEWPHTEAKLKEFLDEIGVGQVVAKDDEEAKVLWEEQKIKVKEALAFVDIELLKSRKEVLDIAKVEYNDRVTKIENLLASKVRLVDSNNVPLDQRKRIGNIVEKIRKFLPVDPRFSEKYRTPKGKWDNKMLFVTNYDVLLKMYYDILQTRGELPSELDTSTRNPGGTTVQPADGGTLVGLQPSGN